MTPLADLPDDERLRLVLLSRIGIRLEVAFTRDYPPEENDWESLDGDPQFMYDYLMKLAGSDKHRYIRVYP